MDPLACPALAQGFKGANEPRYRRIVVEAGVDAGSRARNDHHIGRALPVLWKHGLHGFVDIEV
ncbi:hypothetical protein YH62_19360 [Rhizobium sp. LC145]|nr:hypothetical protein YH62_19360 [Rhizobium sp. LC145]